MRKTFFLALAAACTALAATAPVTISATPGTAEIRLGAKLDFNAPVANTTNKTVTWRVNDIAGGNSTVGTIDANGLYQAPAAMPPSGATVRIKAVSAADASKSATATVALLNPVPRISELVPYNVNQGLGFALVVKGTTFIRGARVQIDGAALTTSFVSESELRASSLTNAPAGTYLNVMVLNPNPGAASSNVKQLRVLAPVSVNVWPDTRSMRAGATYDFGVSVSNNSDKTVTWYVNDVKGGNAALGTVDAEGLYTAPAVLPTGNTVNVRAVSVADPRASDATPVTLLNPLPVVTKVDPAALAIGAARTFALHGTGFVPGSTVAFDDRPVTAKFVSPTQLSITTDVPPAIGGYSRVAVTNGDPGGSKSPDFPVEVKPTGTKMSYAGAARFLEQASWGPTPASIARVMEIGREAWINEQFALPMSAYADPTDTDQGLSSLQKQFFRNALQRDDQLRQRAAFALGQIFVVSGVELGRYWQIVPWQRLLMNNAFGNYGPLMKEVTLSPAMGEYLDMVNNDKPNPTRGLVPNENYGRELLQLFTLGLFELNANGTRKTNSAGQPISTYTEDHVKHLSLTFTGWTYPPQPGFASKWTNPRYYYGRMIAFEDRHDLSAKTILPGVTLPANQTAEQDVNAALAAIFNHSNLGPFVATRLIQRFVTGNPSPEYVARVTAAFNTPVRGDLKNTIRAILLDPEAGTGPDAPAVLPATQGHLREPVLFSLSLLRALGATTTEEPNLPYIVETMGQKLFFSPSVFNYFSPGYRLPGAGITAPEFQILNPTTALARVNFVYRTVTNSISSSIKVPVNHFAGLAADPAILNKAIGNALLRGAMQPDMEQTIQKAIIGTNDRTQRARTALYLTGSQARYQVQR